MDPSFGLTYPSGTLSHPLPLVLATLLADTASHIGGVGAVLEVAAARCHQRCLELLRPFLVGLGEAADLVEAQAQVSHDLPERLAGVDAIQELPPYLDR